MPNDAKLGLVVGVALVLFIAAVFFRKETLSPNDPDPASHGSAAATPKARPKPPPPDTVESEPSALTEDLGLPAPATP